MLMPSVSKDRGLIRADPKEPLACRVISTIPSASSFLSPGDPEWWRLTQFAACLPCTHIEGMMKVENLIFTDVWACSTYGGGPALHMPGELSITKTMDARKGAVSRGKAGLLGAGEPGRMP